MNIVVVVGAGGGGGIACLTFLFVRCYNFCARALTGFVLFAGTKVLKHFLDAAPFFFLFRRYSLRCYVNLLS